MPDLRVPMERVINGYRMCAGYPEDHIDAVPNKTLNDELTTGHASQYRGQARRKRLCQRFSRSCCCLRSFGGLLRSRRLRIAICFCRRYHLSTSPAGDFGIDPTTKRFTSEARNEVVGCDFGHSVT